MTDGPGAPAPGDADAPLSVVATAGHVDHGKSSLILRLTGTDPDRLAEEKRRGLTIDLGFAWRTLPSGREIGFVDVPGHERFVRTMLAGVGPVRLVLFVVAADEGWKPQSEEHLSIVDVLGVDGAVVALTKRDLVDAEALAATDRDVRERLRGTALETAGIVACSSATGEGIEELVSALDEMVAAAPEPSRAGRVRQFVDRVFSAKGSGTVVTGTLTGGPLAVGDEVQVQPADVRARIRGLQTHKRTIDVARPVSRVAANLAGVERTALERGDVVGRPGEWRPTAVFEARVRAIRGLAKPVTARGAFKLHAGAAERDASIRIYGTTSFGENGAFARIRLSAPLVLDVFDRFVLRESGRRETVAGGIVLDPHPPARAGPDPGARLSARERSRREDLPALLVTERGALRADEVILLTGERAEAVGEAHQAGPWWIADGVFRAAGAAIEQEVTAFHEREPLAPGMHPAAARWSLMRAMRQAGAPADTELADALLDGLVNDGALARDGAFVRLASHRVERSADVDPLVAAVAAGEPTPPSIAELVRAGHDRATIDAATRSGELVRISPELVVTRAFVERAIEAIRDAGEAGATVAAVRERLGTSRKYAVPLMEHLDRSGATRRSGDVRLLRSTV